jgi:hypothetical protein
MLPVHGNKMPGSGDGKNGLEDLARQAANQIFGYRRQCLWIRITLMQIRIRFDLLPGCISGSRS